MKDKEPNFEYATTRELLIELSTRGQNLGDAMGAHLESTVDELISELNSRTLNYRTCDDE